MARLNYLNSAKQNLRSIVRHLAHQSGSRFIAYQFAELLRHKCQHLAVLPGSMGRPRPELGSGFRSFAFRGYVIVFRYVEDTMEIINIFEGHKDIDAHFGEQED